MRIETTGTDEGLARTESRQEEIDQLERTMLAGAPVVNLPLVNRFTPGLYAREIFMPAGTLLTSRIHNTEHPYVILTGEVSVFIEGVGVERMAAPFVGVTKPHTRRILYIHEDCRWITFHPLQDGEGENGEADLEKIEERIIERRELSDGKTAFELYSEALRALELPPAEMAEDHQEDPSCLG